ncbi:MAG TPA: TPM domain-containing protein [Myxococcota bacterium]|nr:TPM domain-containing protein [Myxococcota bacterium]
MDRATLLSPGMRDSLERSLSDYERNTGHQIVVHTTPSLEGLAIEDYSIQVAEAWKVGQKGLDNGVILTVAPNEHKVRIEVGYGLEGVLPDAIAARIIRDEITPRFRSGQMDQGIFAGVRAIEKVIAGEQLPVPQRPKTPKVDWLELLWIAFLVVFVLGRSPLLWWLFGASALSSRRGPWTGSGWGGGYGGGGFGGGGAGSSW